MLNERQGKGLLALYIPQDNTPVPTTRRQCLPVRAEGYAIYVTCMADEGLATGSSALHIPQNDALIPATRRQRLPIRAEGHAGHVARVYNERREEGFFLRFCFLVLRFENNPIRFAPCLLIIKNAHILYIKYLEYISFLNTILYFL